MHKLKTKLIFSSLILFLSLITPACASEITGGISTQGVIPINPSGVDAKLDETGGRAITVTWNAVGGVAGYKIYQSKNGDTFSMVETTSNLSYHAQSLANGNYSYQVQAYKGSLVSNVNKAIPTLPITIAYTAPVVPPVTPPSSGGGGGGGGGYTPPVILPTNATTTSSTTPIIGDINSSGTVDKYDFALMMADWGKTGNNIASDLNGDLKVDKYDFALLMAHWS